MNNSLNWWYLVSAKTRMSGPPLRRPSCHQIKQLELFQPKISREAKECRLTRTYHWTNLLTWCSLGAKVLCLRQKTTASKVELCTKPAREFLHSPTTPEDPASPASTSFSWDVDYLLTPEPTAFHKILAQLTYIPCNFQVDQDSPQCPDHQPGRA